MVQATRTTHTPSEEILTRQLLVSVALGRHEADLVLEGATLLNSHTLTWKENWDIVIKGQRIAWVGPHGEWKGSARKKTSVRGLWAVPGFGEAHKHIESTMLSPEYEADLVLRFGTTWNVEASHEFSNVNGARNVEFWLMARAQGSPFKIFPSLGSATPPTGWEESGGYYGYREIRDFIDRNLWVTGLDEVMDWSAVVNRENPGYQRLWENIEATLGGARSGRGTRHRPDFARGNLRLCCGGNQFGPRNPRRAGSLGQAGARDFSRSAAQCHAHPQIFWWRKVCAIGRTLRLPPTTATPKPLCAAARWTTTFAAPSRLACLWKSPTHWAATTPRATSASITWWARSPPAATPTWCCCQIPEQVKIKAVYADGIKVSEDYKMLVPVPKIEWPEWATKTVNLGRKIEAADFAVGAPAGRISMQAAVVPPFHFERDFFTVELPVKDGVVQRDEAQAITKVALLDRYSGRTRVSRMFWKDVGMKTPDSAMACSIVHDNHNAWVIGSSDQAMAVAINAMAEMDGGFVLVSHGKVVAKVRLEVGGLMTARPAEQLASDLLAMRAEMEKLEWMEKPVLRIQEFLGVDHVTEALCYAFLTCPPWNWTFMPPSDALPEGFVNVRTGETHPVVW